MTHYLLLISRPVASALAAAALSGTACLAYFVRAVYVADAADDRSASVVSSRPAS